MKQVVGLVVLAFLFGNVQAGGPSARIVNGTQVVSIANYRYYVAIRIDDFAICGASVISFKHVLSAAHCLDTKPPVSTVTIYGGSTDQYDGGVIFKVGSYIIHPDYVRSGINYDAAIVFTATTMAGHQYIAPVPLQTTEIALGPSRNVWCYIIGWGYTDGLRETNPEYLQLIWMQLISHYNCAYQWGDELLTPEMICTQLPRVDICSGDSGGPLVCNGKLTGIVSWGTSECSADWPAVFAKDFVNQHSKLH